MVASVSAGAASGKPATAASRSKCPGRPVSDHFFEPHLLALTVRTSNATRLGFSIGQSPGS
jgi:hypothetical protein